MTHATAVESQDTVQAELYRHAVEHGAIDPGSCVPGLPLSAHEVAQACAALQKLRLLAPAHAGTALVPVHPSVAAELLNQSLRSEIRTRQQEIEDNELVLRQFAAQVPHPAAAAEITVIRDPAQAAALHASAAARCVDEVVGVHLGTAFEPQLLERSVAECAAQQARGVRGRLIFQHVSRSNLGMRGYFRAVQRHGVAVSTSSESFEAMTIYDRHTAFIPLGHCDGFEGAVMIVNPPVVQYLRQIFERLWAGALPFEDSESAHELAFSDDRLLLLRLLAAGLKDEVIAKRLGIAVRTCRRYVANLLQDLGATSRFQAGVRAGQLGLLPGEPAHLGHPTAWVDAHPLS